MERVSIKTSQVWLASFLDQFYPVTYADFEIEIGRPNTAVQIKRFERKVREILSREAFDILAISCWTSLSYQASLTVARVCRELYPDCVIVVGGYHPSARPREFITEERLFDYIVTREGELALKDIADHFHETGRPPQPRIITGPTVSGDLFVPFKWDLTEPFYSRNFKEPIDYACVYLSRGCPFGCSFCMEPSKERIWRAFSPEEAVALTFDVVDRFHLFSVAAADACFGMRSAWRKQFLRLMAERQPEFWFVFETRPEYLDDEDIELVSHLKVEIQFGIESCSPDILRLMRKTRQPDKFLQKFSDVSHKLSERNVLHRANMIFNHPGETRRTLDETFAFIDQELNHGDSSLMWASHGYMHFPGCEIDTNRAFYEQTCGSRFLCGDWWKDDQDQYEHSQQFIPSRDLDGDNVGLWKVMLKEREEKMKSALSPKAFRFAAFKYFLEWQDDYRYKHR
jgi:radical SAM superfamily enzyme YgiQ (UPF0313 family)